MEELYFIGLLGISYLYWTILAFFIALVTLFIRIPPFALPSNPNNWILKKFILYYFHITAWLLISWVCYRLYRLDGEWTAWLHMLAGLAVLLMMTFIVVWVFDRFQIRKMKEKNIKNKSYEQDTKL